MAISFKATPEDFRIIEKIAARAAKEIKLKGASEMHWMMNVAAAHANGCQIDLEKLLNFDSFNFLHDMLGIERHLNKDTGKLENFFIPRSVKRMED